MTPVRDLGNLDGPVLVFGGPHGNLAATEALRALSETFGFAPERTICTGDMIAYCAEPEETVRLVREWGISVIMGNCEEALASSAPDCGCGFDEGSTCSALSVEWYRHADERVSDKSRAWMAALPRALRFELNGKSILVVHGGVSRINHFLFASDTKEIRGELALAGTDMVLAGHCGIPFGQRYGEKAWLNAGVIGMPANDGTTDGWFMLLEPEGRRVKATWHRLAYDAETTRRRMMEAGLRAGYAETVLSGLWPSEDVLPEKEKTLRGLPLNPPPLFF
jgi:predicted phosphodiesterase